MEALRKKVQKKIDKRLGTKVAALAKELNISEPTLKKIRDLDDSVSLDTLYKVDKKI